MEKQNATTTRFVRTAEGGRRIMLMKPLSTHGAPITAITLRAPLWAEYMEIGEIHIPSRSGETVTVVDDSQAVRAYAERLMQPDAAEFIAQISLADTLTIRDAVLDFFEEARSVTSEAHSSSHQDRPTATAQGSVSPTPSGAMPPSSLAAREA